MSWAKGVTEIAFPKDPGLTTGSFKVGDLMGLDTDSQIVNGAGLGVFPLKENFDVAGGDINGSLAMIGIAQVKITTITNIDVMSPISYASANGGKLAAAGENYIGFALQKPTVANQLIPVLLQRGKMQTA